MAPHFQIPLDLPHAGRVATRLAACVEALEEHHKRPLPGMALAGQELVQLLGEYLFGGENPPPPKARQVCEQAAAIGIRFVEETEREGVGYDRLGQCVRNLFECLERGEEGAELGLRAGENPRSLQRPV